MGYIKLKLNYGRNALRYLIRTFDIEEINIPYYLCDEIRHSILKENCKAIFYHIDDNFMPVTDFCETDYILYPNYFGICDNNVDTLTKIYPKLIVDNCHSFYSEPKGFACFNSERKFHPVEFGSYLWTKKIGSQLKYQTETRINYNNINHYENSIAKIEPMFVKEHQIDFSDSITQRLKNFEELHNIYSKTNLLKIDLKSSSSPFCYPYLSETKQEANKLVNKLEKEGKNIYRYWKNLPKNYNEYKFFSQLVPIPLFESYSPIILN